MGVIHMCKYYSPIYDTEIIQVGVDEMGYPLYEEHTIQVGFACEFRHDYNVDCNGCVYNK